MPGTTENFHRTFTVADTPALPNPATRIQGICSSFVPEEQITTPWALALQTPPPSRCSPKGCWVNA